MTSEKSTLYSSLVDSLEHRRPVCLVLLLAPAGDTATRLLLAPDGAVAGELPAAPLGPWLQEGARQALAGRRAISLVAPPGVAAGVEAYFEPYPPRPGLLILGGGHIGKAVYDLTAGLGLFDLCIADDRPAYSDPRRFPAARTVCCDFAEVFQQVPVDRDGFVLIVTRGHRADRLCLSHALRTPARYIGMIGSRRKVALTYRHLRESGFGPADFARVHAPVGLALAACGASEIAVSILAELLAVKNGVDPSRVGSMSASRRVAGEQDAKG
ncbi:MAG: XdhC family protein [Candidatus Riflebacteria bacterium]|nr:XdhC family protein [Candidatus Riflebacteria bacterium]